VNILTLLIISHLIYIHSI